jgi:hypothetical protein
MWLVGENGLENKEDWDIFTTDSLVKMWWARNSNPQSEIARVPQVLRSFLSNEG